MLSFSLLHEIDVSAGRRLHNIGDLSDDDVINVMRHQCRQLPEATSDEPGVHLQRLTAIACLRNDGEVFKRDYFVINAGNESAQLQAFFEELQTADRVVTYSRRQSSYDLLCNRALLRELSFLPALANG